MSFLYDFVGQHRKSALNINTESGNEEEFCEVLVKEDDSNASATSISEENSIFAAPSCYSSNVPNYKKMKMSSSDLVNTSTIEVIKLRSEQERQEFISSTIKFFKSLVPDIEKLSSRRQREFKGKVLSLLNDLLDEQENEMYPPQSAMYDPSMDMHHDLNMG